jgi:hypothetical protein
MIRRQMSPLVSAATSIHPAGAKALIDVLAVWLNPVTMEVLSLVSGAVIIVQYGLGAMYAADTDHAHRLFSVERSVEIRSWSAWGQMTSKKGKSG